MCIRLILPTVALSAFAATSRPKKALVSFSKKYLKPSI